MKTIEHEHGRMFVCVWGVCGVCVCGVCVGCVCGVGGGCVGAGVSVQTEKETVSVRKGQE